MFAGVTVVAWYPITPSSSLPETLIGYMRKYRIDKETGKATFAIVQAEDEIAAIGMVVGAGWAGARAMTSTSGPGISLMSEFAGPRVLRRAARRGLRHPARGAVDRPADAHGAGRHPVHGADLARRHQARLLIPASVEECYKMAMDAFDLAERFQTLVFVMSDLDLGMNTWMARAVRRIPDKPLDRGKVLDAAKLAADWASGAATRTWTATAFRTARFRAPACRRTSRAAPATTRRGSTASGPTTTSTNLDRLARKFETARSSCRSPSDRRRSEAEIGIIAYGTSHWAIEESRDQLEREAGIRPRYLRLRAYPFTPELDAVHRPLRSRLRRRAEPRRADARA